MFNQWTLPLTETTTIKDIVDATVNPNPDDIADYVTFVSPVFEIPPYTEVNIALMVHTRDLILA